MYCQYTDMSLKPTITYVCIPWYQKINHFPLILRPVLQVNTVKEVVAGKVTGKQLFKK